MKIRVSDDQIEARADTGHIVSARVVFRVRRGCIIPVLVFDASEDDTKKLRKMRSRILALVKPLVVALGKAELAIETKDDPSWIRRPKGLKNSTRRQ
jgi:hypothetical protein